MNAGPSRSRAVASGGHGGGSQGGGGGDSSAIGAADNAARRRRGRRAAGHGGGRDPLHVVYALTKYHQLSQTFVDLEIGELRRQGATVTVVSVERGHVERDGTVYLDTAPAAPAAHLRWLVTHPLRYARFLWRVAGYRREMGAKPELVPWWRLPAVARRLDADVVHAHFGWSGATTAALLGALLGVPWSMTLHAKDIFTKRRNLDRKLSSADLVVTVCEYNRDYIETELEPWVPNLEVLTCGVVPPPAGRREPEVDVVTVARLIPKKGIDTLLRALPEDVTCEVIGDGPELGALKAIAGPNVTFRGALPHDEALDRIARARVFALPCRIAPDGDRDAMPTVIVEAMMRGVPVVSTTVAGIPEMVDDGVGRLVPPDDPGALRDAITALLDPALNTRLGEHASLHARQRFALDKQAGRLLTLLEGIAR